MSSKLPWVIFLGFIGLGCTENASESRCFSFTWVGPTFDNDTITNATCKELPIIGDGGACITPMVYTDNGKPPDLKEIWRKHKESLTCRLVKGKVCAKWTQYYEDTVEYQTYMCTNILVEKEGPMKSGCIENKTDSRWTEVCACRSAVGDVPCNYAATHSILYCLLIAAIIVTAYLT